MHGGVPRKKDITEYNARKRMSLAEQCNANTYFTVANAPVARRAEPANCDGNKERKASVVRNVVQTQKRAGEGAHTCNGDLFCVICSLCVWTHVSEINPSSVHRLYDKNAYDIYIFYVILNHCPRKKSFWRFLEIRNPEKCLKLQLHATPFVC